MKAANSLKKTRPVILRGAQLDTSNALKYAWWFESFRKQLQSDVYRFSYFKKDGGIREARGTLCEKYIPFRAQPKGVYEAEGKKEPLRFNYYDLDAGWWRSFYLDNFIGFVSPVGSALGANSPS